MKLAMGVKFTGGSVVITRVREEEVVQLRRRRGALKLVDRHLSKNNYKLALSLLKQSSLSGFAAATQVPPRVLSVDHLHLTALQSLLDAILYSINTSLQSAPLDENSVTAEHNYLFLEHHIVEHKQVVHHEAGHFLVGYLLGVLPKQYKVSSTGHHIVDASVKFFGFEFLTELEDLLPSDKNLHLVKAGHRANKRKLSSTVLRKFASVMVGGLVAEHLAFGHSKGHHGDVDKLYRVLKWLQFSEEEANTLTRWAALNTLTILHRQSKAISALAEAMSHGRSIGYCIDTIESNLNHQNI